MLAVPIQVCAESLLVADFESGDLSGWEGKEFKGRTFYSVVDSGGKKALEARSSSAASGMYREVKIDLAKTPYLNWSWKVENTFPGVNEKSKSGDDYPARVYVVFSGGILFWKTRALNYVWSSHQPVGSSWPNAYTKNAVMMAVRSGKRDTGRWVRQKRNVREDFRRLFGEDVSKADAVAIMTDTDNSGRSATAYYGNIFFSSE